jgi:hypothetical protein
MKLARSMWIAIACTCSALAGCYVFNEPEAADTNTNWLACESDSDCTTGSVCRAGRCVAARSGAPTTTGTVTDAGDDAGATPISTEANGSLVSEPPPLPTRGSRSVELADVTAADGSFRISDASLEAGAPAVRWLDDHFEVAFGAMEHRAGALRRLEVASVYEDRVESVWADHGPVLGGLEIAADGTIASAIGADNDTDCIVDFYRPSLEGERSTLVVPCFETRAAVGSAASGSNWPIVVASKSNVKLGRYDPWTKTWLRPLEIVDSRSDANVVATIDDGDDSIVVWGGEYTYPSRMVPLESTTYAARVSNGALGSEVPAEVGDTVSFAGAVPSDGPYALATIAGNVLVLGFDRESLWSAALKSDGAEPPVNTLPFSGIVGGAVAVPLEEHDLVGVFFGTNPTLVGAVGGVSFVLVDAEGVPMTDPTVVTTEGVVAGFDVAWSGTELLAVWWLIQGDPRTVSEVRGLRIPGPT